MSQDADDLIVLRRRLQQSDDRLRTLLESALDCIVTMDGKGVILEFNPAAERTFGYSRKQAVGRTVEELLVPPRLREAHRRGLQAYHKTGTGPVLGQRVEIDAIRADGSEFPVELTIVPTSIDGQPFFTAFIRDLTDRKRGDQERERLLKELQEKVDDLERFHDLTVDRELKMMELKKELERLRQSSRQEPDFQ
jgi:PAS domain S-box-containing protein